MLFSRERDEHEGGIVLMAGQNAGEFEDNTGLRASIVAARSVGGVVKNTGGARVVVAANDYEAIAMAAG